MPVIQGICDELVEIWGERRSVRRRQWDLIGPRQGEKAEEEACVEEPHLQLDFALDA